MIRLARQFKVSTLVILRQIHDTGGLSRQEFWQEFNLELERLMGSQNPVAVISILRKERD